LQDFTLFSSYDVYFTAHQLSTTDELILIKRKKDKVRAS